MKRGNPEPRSIVHYMEDDSNKPICNIKDWDIYYTDYKPQVTCPICKDKLD